MDLVLKFAAPKLAPKELEPTILKRTIEELEKELDVSSCPVHQALVSRTGRTKKILQFEDMRIKVMLIICFVAL